VRKAAGASQGRRVGQRLIGSGREGDDLERTAFWRIVHEPLDHLFDPAVRAWQRLLV